jgi:hypothetical protein
VTLRRNTLTGRSLTVRADQNGDRPRNIAIRENASQRRFAGPPPAALFFRDTDGVTVAGNVQAVRRGLAMVATENSTRVDVATDQSPYRKIGPGSERARNLAGGLGGALFMLGLLRWRLGRLRER